MSQFFNTRRIPISRGMKSSFDLMAVESLLSRSSTYVGGALGLARRASASKLCFRLETIEMNDVTKKILTPSIVFKVLLFVEFLDLSKKVILDSFK